MSRTSLFAALAALLMGGSLAIQAGAAGSEGKAPPAVRRGVAGGGPVAGDPSQAPTATASATASAARETLAAAASGADHAQGAGSAGAGSVAAEAGEPRATEVTHAGTLWTETVNGASTVPSSGKFHIRARGAVAVRGDAGEGARYVLVKRVRARTEAEARRRLRQYQVRFLQEGDETSLEVAHAGDDGQGAELRVNVPRSLREVVVETHGGSVEAADLDGALRAETGGGRMKMDRIGGDVTARTAGGEIELGTIGGSLRCTSAGGSINAVSIGGGAEFETAGGEIEVGEVRGMVSATTAGGGIRIQKAGGAVSASTAGGAIEIAKARGMVTAKTLGGPIEVGDAIGASCQTAGGAIRLANVSGGLRAWTAVGSIFANLASGRRIEDSTLTTGGGDITVVIPDNFSVTIRAENASPGSRGRIISDFPGFEVKTLGMLAVAEGKVHGGGPLLKLAGTGGTIFIKKQDD